MRFGHDSAGRMLAKRARIIFCWWWPAIFQSRTATQVIWLARGFAILECYSVYILRNRQNPIHRRGPMNQQGPDQFGSHRPGRQRPEAFFVRIGFAILIAVCAAASLFIIFRPFFLSHFDAILADPGDGRFEVTILEHWTRVLHGQAQIASPNFFYPEKGVLGYSDALVGLGIPFAGFRWLGSDRYLALELVMMLVTVLGLWGMYRLLREVLHFPRSTSLFGAFLFIISNMYYIDLVHIHLNFVALAPWLFVFIARFWRARASRPVVARLWICAFSVLLALFFYTTYYDSWFLIVCSASGIVFYLACDYFVGGEQTVSRTLREIRAQTWNLLLGFCVFVLAMVPFFVLYLPSLHRTGHRTLGETLYFMPTPLGIFDVGRDSLVWGKMSARIQEAISPGGIHEHPTGWPLLTLLVFVAVSIYCGISLWRSRRGDRSIQETLLCTMSAIALTCLTLWTAGVRVGQHAPVWALLWRFVPGAAAIRVPQRINLVLNLGVVIVCMFGLEMLRRRLAAGGALAYVIPALLAGGLVVEQINFMPTHLISRNAEAQKFARIPPPPKGCSSFYISDWSNSASGMHVTQTDAMLVAQQYDIPTIDGYSSWFPTGWDLMWAPRGHVTTAANDWAKQKGVSDGLCVLEMNWGVWKPAAEAESADSSVPSQPVAGEVTNSGFEDSDIDSWALFQGVRAEGTTLRAHSGLHSLAESDGVGSVYQDVSGLRPGRQYRISAFVAASPGATAGSQLAVYDPSANVAIFSQPLHPGSDWQVLSDFVTLGNSTTLRIHLFRTEGTGTIYWDDVRIDPDNGPDDANTKH